MAGRALQRDASRTTGAALESHYRFLLWLVPAVERFPRSQKFLLGDRIQGTALPNSRSQVLALSAMILLDPIHPISIKRRRHN